MVAAFLGADPVLHRVVTSGHYGAWPDVLAMPYDDFLGAVAWVDLLSIPPPEVKP